MKEIGVIDPLITPHINESFEQQDYSLDVMTSTPTTPNSAYPLDHHQQRNNSDKSTSDDEEPEDDYPGRNLSIEDTDLVLCDLSLDRSDDLSPTDEPPVSPVPDPVLMSKMPSKRSTNSKNSIISDRNRHPPIQTKRYPSFRDIFFLPLRSKRRTSSEVDHSFESSESIVNNQSTKKSKQQGCGAWFDKKKRKSKKMSSDDEDDASDESPPPLVKVDLSASVSSHLMMQCAKCSRLDGLPANFNLQTNGKDVRGATFTKCPLDGEWLCDQCANRVDSEKYEPADEWSNKDKVPPLAYLAIDVLKVNVRHFLNPWCIIKHSSLGRISKLEYRLTFYEFITTDSFNFVVNFETTVKI